jgi:hypothetical protein
VGVAVLALVGVIVHRVVELTLVPQELQCINQIMAFTVHHIVPVKVILLQQLYMEVPYFNFLLSITGQFPIIALEN